MALNAQYFLKTGGNFVISIKASCIDSTAQPEAVFAREVKKLVESQLKPKEQVGGAVLDRGGGMQGLWNTVLAGWVHRRLAGWLAGCCAGGTRKHCVVQCSHG